jgi:hypothetical protein
VVEVFAQVSLFASPTPQYCQLATQRSLVYLLRRGDQAAMLSQGNTAVRKNNTIGRKIEVHS